MPARTPGCSSELTVVGAANLADPPDRRQGGGEKNALVVELDGEPQATRSTASMKFEHGAAAGHVTVIEAIATGGRDARALARPARHGLEGDVEGQPAPDRPSARAPARTTPGGCRCVIGDGLWVRLVDVGAALAARAYGGDGPVVLEVEDPFLPENSGRWRIAGGTAERTDDDADLALDVASSARRTSAGSRSRSSLRAGVVRELKEGGAARADAVFLTDGAQAVVPRDLLTTLLPCRAECCGHSSARSARSSSA